MLFCHVSLPKKQHRVRRAPPSHPRGTYTVWSPLTRTARIQVHIQTLLNITRLSHNKQQPRARPRATVAHRNSGTLDVTAHDRGHVRSSAHDIPPSEVRADLGAQRLRAHSSTNPEPWVSKRVLAVERHAVNCITLSHTAMLVTAFMAERCTPERQARILGFDPSEQAPGLGDWYQQREAPLPSSSGLPLCGSVASAMTRSS
jgi:hypothetical protein